MPEHSLPNGGQQDSIFTPQSLEEAQAYLEAFKQGSAIVHKMMGQEIFDAQNQVARLQDAAERDSKSGLATETKWRQDLVKTTENLKEGEKVIVMIGDLNGFKAVNDEYGHTAGDELLGLVGQAFSMTFKRKADHLARGNRDVDVNISRGSMARLGGDEFSVFTVIADEQESTDDHSRTTDTDDILKIQSERLNNAIQELTRGTKFEKFQVGIALGGVEYDPSIDKSPEDTFIRADAKMYEAKYQGKMDKITPEDADNLRRIIPYLKGLGARVEQWLEDAAFNVDEG